jgi:hypothetical protein
MPQEPAGVTQILMWLLAGCPQGPEKEKEHGEVARSRDG